MCGLRFYYSRGAGYQVPVYTSESVPLACGGGQGVFHCTVGDSYSQGRAVEPHKEGYGTSQPHSVRGAGHAMNSTPYFSKVGEFSDWGQRPIVQGHSEFSMTGSNQLSGTGTGRFLTGDSAYMFSEPIPNKKEL